MSQWRIPSVNDSAGRTENLVNTSATHLSGLGIVNTTHRRPRQKNALRVALLPRIAQARPRYVVRRSTALSSTKTSWSGAYSPTRSAKLARASALRSSAIRLSCQAVRYWKMWSQNTYLFHRISTLYQCPPDSWQRYWNPTDFLQLQT